MGAARDTRGSLARPFAAIALSGMAYCHIKDVGMKFDEHVYYMATLFCCNIAMSVALVPTVLSLGKLPVRLHSYVWAGASALAALTIVGFAWSRTLGFPQMADHVGDWDTLGLSSVGFEALVIAVSVWMLAELPHAGAAGGSASTLGAL